jgi:hypothetical protein
MNGCMQRLTFRVLAPPALLLAAFLAMTLAPGQAAHAADLTITKPWASVRARPEAQAPAVALVFGNDALPVLRQTPGWVQVRLPGGRTGWIDRTHGALETPPVAQPPVAQPPVAQPAGALSTPASLVTDWDLAPGGT